LRLEPFSEGLRDRVWWGSGSNATAVWAAQLGMNLQASTLKNDESGAPFHVQQAVQIQAFRDAWKELSESTRWPVLFHLMRSLRRPVSPAWAWIRRPRLTCLLNWRTGSGSSSVPRSFSSIQQLGIWRASWPGNHQHRTAAIDAEHRLFGRVAEALGHNAA